MWSPFLLGLLPILYVFYGNIGKVAASELLTPIAIAWILLGLLLFLVNLILRSWHKSAVFGSVFTLLFISYQPLSKTLIAHKFFNSTTSCHYFLTFFSLGIAIALLVLLKRSKDSSTPISAFLTRFSGIALFIMLLNIGLHNNSTVAPNNVSPATTSKLVASKFPVPAHDIFFILLDGYGRSDIFKEIYNFDNSEFISQLEQLGFYVAKQSHSNYCQTLLSLGSNLNMRYLSEIPNVIDRRSRDRSIIQKWVTDSQVVSFLKGLGYTFVSFSSGYSGTRMQQVDYEISSVYSISEFQNTLLRFTPIPDLLGALPFRTLRYWQYAAHRNRINFQFDNLPKATEYPSPKFVFAHIMAPHPPFVFDKDGIAINYDLEFNFSDGVPLSNRIGLDTYHKNYAAEARYVTKRILAAIKEIRAKSPQAIIIVQGDHGPGSYLDWNNLKVSNVKERFSILNAMYVPEEVKSHLYPTISPVNTFRAILKFHFGVDLELLKDESFFSSFKNPYRFTRVTKRLLKDK